MNDDTTTAKVLHDRTAATIDNSDLDSAAVLLSTYPTQDGHLIAEMILNAPDSLNALSTEMCQIIDTQLSEWQRDDNVVAVMLRGAGDKAFCAGGDIRKLYESMSYNAPLPNPYATQFFGSEYSLYRKMHYYTKPLILWGTGFIMGGGMGLMAACSHRIVTETTKFAMPEITIGLFPDASGSWFLQRMPAKTGLFMGLTGAMGNANDAKFANLAEYTLPSDSYSQVIAALTAADWQTVASQIDSIAIKQPTANQSKLYHDANHQVSRCLAKLSQALTCNSTPSNLAQYWQTIQTLMNRGSLQDIDAILQDDMQLAQLDADFADNTWTQRAVATYRHGCPVSAALTYELFYRVEGLSLEQILYLEANVALHCADNPDFREGIRALLIDKDKDPKWSHTLAECFSDEGKAYIANHFNNPYPAEQHIFGDWIGMNALSSRSVK